MLYLILFTDGQSAVEVQLVTRKFVEKGSSITLQCRHNVEPRILHKVCFMLLFHGNLFSCCVVGGSKWEARQIKGITCRWMFKEAAEYLIYSVSVWCLKIYEYFIILIECNWINCQNLLYQWQPTSFFTNLRIPGNFCWCEQRKYEKY